jgi:hypothetical protein
MKMTIAGVMLPILLVFGSGVPCSSQDTAVRANAEEARSRIAGVWRGHSVCVDKSSPCHDEVNVYRFASIAGRPDAFSVTASKIVDGKEIVMGSSEWQYDAGKRVVESKAPPIRLAIDGDKMEGALTLPDGKAYRRIYLQKED